MELSAQRSAASSLGGLHRSSRPQASLLPPAASFHGKPVISQLHQVLNVAAAAPFGVTLCSAWDWGVHRTHMQQQQAGERLRGASTDTSS
jgi:hypothetical protein